MVDLGEKSASPPVETNAPTTMLDSGEKQRETQDETREPREPTSENGGHDSDDDDDSDSKDELPLSKARCIALVATVTGASFLNTLSGQSVVIILPEIGRDLNVPDTRQQWIVSSYILTFGCFLLLWGRIADIYGKRLIFIIGSIWVTVVTAVNPFLPTEIAFDLFRGLHGLGAAANVPTAIGILGVTFPPGKAKNYAFSAYASGAPLGSVCGNLISGLIAEYASWKWVFGAGAILAGIISVAGIIFIPPPPPVAHNKKSKTAEVDWIGATLITVGLIALMFALTEGNVVGWSTPWVPVLIVVSLLIIVAFGFWQWYLETKTTRPPLVKVSIFRNWRFTAVMLIMGLFFASFNNFLIYVTYFFQEFQGLSPLQTMLRFIPTGVGGILIAFIVAQLLGRVPTFFLLVCGNLSVSIASLLYAVPIAPTTSYFARGFPAMILSVIGADTAWPCLTLFVSHALSSGDQAVGGALINAVGMFGRAIGLAIATAVQTAVQADAQGVDVEDVGPMVQWDSKTLKGLRAASWVNFAFGIGALFVVIVTFRGMEIVGKAGVKERSGGEEGIMNEENIDVERRGER
ncbi:Fc.00g064870.m01.CDS01 [Cosmosporella sp. VM-42]